MANDDDDDLSEDSGADEEIPSIGFRANDLDTPTPPARGWTRPPSEEKYAALWARFRDGVRVGRELAKLCRVDMRTALTAIRRGWPEKGWPPLNERLILWNKQRENVRSNELARDRAAATEAGKTEASKWREITDAMWPSVRDLATLCCQASDSLKRSVRLATLIKYRDVTRLAKDGKSTVTVSEAYVDQAAHSRAMFLLANTMKELPNIARVVLGPAAEVPEPEVPVFTSEQIAMLQAGEMPPDVTPEMLGLAMLRGALKTQG